MRNILISILSFFLSQPRRVTDVTDSTVYLIETNTRQYCGIIIYQDDIVIRMQCAKPKMVKILKANIERITIVRTEAAQQYWQWQQEKVNSWKITTFPAKM